MYGIRFNLFIMGCSISKIINGYRLIKEYICLDSITQHDLYLLKNIFVAPFFTSSRTFIFSSKTSLPKYLTYFNCN